MIGDPPRIGSGREQDTASSTAQARPAARSRHPTNRRKQLMQTTLFTSDFDPMQAANEIPPPSMPYSDDQKELCCPRGSNQRGRVSPAEKGASDVREQLLGFNPQARRGFGDRRVEHLIVTRSRELRLVRLHQRSTSTGGSVSVFILPLMHHLMQ